MTALLWLTGCVTLDSHPEVQEEVPEQEQAHAQLLEQAQEHVKAMEKTRAQEQGLSPSRMLDALERVATMEPGDSKQMVELLQTGAGNLAAGDRFKLVLLLSQEGANNKSLKQALQLLDGLEAEAKEVSVREVLRLQRHNLRLEQLYRKERKKSVELQKKIEYLKGLERQLDESNKRVKEPPNSNPEQAQ
jgi:hypothetical protein